MRHLFIAALGIVFMYGGLAAQNVRETRMSVLDADRMAHSVEFNYELKVLKDAWKKKVSEMRIKGKHQKGMDTYEGVTFPDIHFENIDLFVKIEKLDKTRSSITLTVSKGYGNFVTAEDAKVVGNIKKFLESFVEYAGQYKLKLDIKDQEDLIKKSEKEQEKLVDEGKKLTEQLEKNKTEQENKVKEIEAQKQSLEEMKSRVK